MTTTDIAPTPARPTGRRAPLRRQLQARSEAARRLVADIEELEATFSTRAAAGDAAAVYPIESLDDLRALGVLRAPIPVELGGLGVETLHDLVVVSSRIARGDASLAIGVNMHLLIAHSFGQSWRHADDLTARRLGGMLSLVADSGVAVAAAVSEPAPQDLSRPSTTAVRDGDGWRVDGAKAFATMSPAADLLSVAVTYVDDAGQERFGFVVVPPSAPGVTVHDDWDALGMRTSGSGRVTLDGVRVELDGITDSHAAGETTVEALDRFVSSGLLHAAATLGIAESAHRIGLERLAPDASGRPLGLVADSAIDLAAMRATLAAAADALDGYWQERPHTIERAADAFAGVQTAKAFVDRAGVRVVDRALELSGGAGYLTKSPLSRAHRDVRAGAFMHPLGANRAYDFVGRVEVGGIPEIR